MEKKSAFESLKAYGLGTALALAGCNTSMLQYPEVPTVEIHADPAPNNITPIITHTHAMIFHEKIAECKAGKSRFSTINPPESLQVFYEKLTAGHPSCDDLRPFIQDTIDIFKACDRMIYTTLADTEIPYFDGNSEVIKLYFTLLEKVRAGAQGISILLTIPEVEACFTPIEYKAFMTRTSGIITSTDFLEKN